MEVNNKRYGYARVSTYDQTLNLQRDALEKSGCDYIFNEVASGKNTQRKALTHCLSQLRSGDTLIVWRLDRLGRSVNDLVRIIAELEVKGVGFESVTERIDTHSHTGKLIFHVFAALAEFERNLIRERTCAGLAAARARGRVGGRKPKLKAAEVQEIMKAVQNKTSSITSLAKHYSVSRNTIYNVIKNRDKFI